VKQAVLNSREKMFVTSNDKTGHRLFVPQVILNGKAGGTFVQLLMSNRKKRFVSSTETFQSRREVAVNR
jgi:hypothetical protein